ncbi:MAG: T9SS type A sorting domain-containing protein [Ignavibacteriaceae bacterium]|jgi:hypothetical protein
MKIALLFFFAFVFSCSLFAQPVFKKQISFLDFDARNPSFIQTLDTDYEDYRWGNAKALLFEGYKDTSKPQIFSLEYDAENDSFYNPTQLTSSKGSCINPVGLLANVGGITMMQKMVWQTNERGNWDIVQAIISGDTLRNIMFIASDSLDEINPRLVIPYYNSNYVFGITYEKAGSIYLNLLRDSSLINEKIFDASGIDSFEYENGFAVISFQFPFEKYFGVAFAVKKYQNGDGKIVFKTKDEYTQLWSDENFLYDSTITTTSPQFISSLHAGNLLSFETKKFGKRILMAFSTSLNGVNSEYAAPISDSSYETFNFSMKPVPQVTKSFKKSNYGYGQSIYQIRKEGKNFLLPDYFNASGRTRDSLIAIKIEEPKITTELVKYDNGWNYIYSIWEDSSANGSIQLFGSSGLYTISGIEDETSPQDFTLYQNYPNPFNPETAINYRLSSSGFVTLKVFDVLGREIETLVNEEKPAGVYQVFFNSQQTTNNKPLSSGVFFYQLKVGNRLHTKSMLLLK